MRRLIRTVRDSLVASSIAAGLFIFMIVQLGGKGQCPICGNPGTHPWEWGNISI